MSTKFSWIQQKMCEIPCFFLTLWHRRPDMPYACITKVNESRHFGALSQKPISYFMLLLFWYNGQSPGICLCSWLSSGLSGGKFKIDQSEGRTSLKNTANGGGMWRFLWLLGICLSWKKKGHFRPIFEPSLRSNQAMKSKPIEQWKILNSISYRKVTAYVWSNR